MLKFRKIAVTGGLSCGKSSVCRFLKELGACVVSSDDIVHQLLSSDTNLGQKIIQLLGNDIVVDQKIDRSRIAQKVFQDPNLLQALEEILHPAVYKEIEKEYQALFTSSGSISDALVFDKGIAPAISEKKNEVNKVKNLQPPLFFAEVPLLFESKGEKNFDCTIVVMANKEQCLERFKKATHYDLNEYEKRSARQFPLLDKAKRADFVIVNDGTMLELKQKSLELYQQLTNYY
jgi:dephospho-CoA kinase